MCSIVGYYKLNKSNKPQQNFVEDTFNLMRRRGPDAESFEEYDNLAGLGHQRLSIIDTSESANMPMNSTKSSIVFNGEIYNYLELRNEFKEHFSTQSDTEVLQKGIEQEGTSFLNKTNGMFAFAFYSKETNQLLLARDRFGVKPLYYTIENQILYFSSEIKPLIKLKKEPKEDSSEYESLIKDSATDHSENTFIKTIKQLKPGHYLKCNNEGISISKWYFGNDYKFDKKIFNNKKQTVDFFEDLLTNAIDIRLRSDVPVSITLSGGLDSTIIYTLIKERLNRSVNVFTFVEPDSKNNEHEPVKKLVNEYNDKIHVVKLEETNGTDSLVEALNYLEFPIWDPSSIVYMNMYKHIHKSGYKVVIEGHSSDEQLGGYPTLAWQAVFELFKKGKILSALKTLRTVEEMSGTKRPTLRLIKMAIGRYTKALTKKERTMSFQKVLDNAFTYQILPIVLRAFDRLTMRSSVESRAPFMDYRIVEFLKLLPLKYKISNIGSKAILREILKKHNKEHIYKNKQKLGFGFDLDKYFDQPEVKTFMKKYAKEYRTTNNNEIKNILSSIDNDAEYSKNKIQIGKLASLAYINKKYGIVKN
jgi:asparagine synthase (glutamine-hydrolysing)